MPNEPVEDQEVDVEDAPAGDDDLPNAPVSDGCPPPDTGCTACEG